MLTQVSSGHDLISHEIPALYFFLSCNLQPIARFQGQATDIDLARKEVKNVKAELVRLVINYTVHFVLLLFQYMVPCVFL